MPRIKDYPRATEIGQNDVFLIDGEAGTRAVLTESLVYSLVDNMNAVAFGYANRKSFYRNKNLGNEITNAQMATIRAGEFRDMFLGDYWRIDGVVWRIVDFDYYFRTYNHANNSYEERHHIILMHDGNTGSMARVHSSNNYTGTAAASAELFTTTLPRYFDGLSANLKNSALEFAVSSYNMTTKIYEANTTPGKIFIATAAQYGKSDGIYLGANNDSPFAIMHLERQNKSRGGNTWGLYSGGFYVNGSYAYNVPLTVPNNIRPYLIIGA